MFPFSGGLTVGSWQVLVAIPHGDGALVTGCATVLAADGAVAGSSGFRGLSGWRRQWGGREPGRGRWGGGGGRCRCSTLDEVSPGRLFLKGQTILFLYLM